MPTQQLGTEATSHQGDTVRMGDDPETSALDTFFKPHRVDKPLSGGQLVVRLGGGGLPRADDRRAPAVGGGVGSVDGRRARCGLGGVFTSKARCGEGTAPLREATKPRSSDRPSPCPSRTCRPSTPVASAASGGAESVRTEPSRHTGTVDGFCETSVRD